MTASSMMKGARLEFVVRELKGKVSRPVASYNPKTKKLEQTMRSQEAGYIVYLPSGQSYRLTNKQLIKKGYDRQPEILNFDRVTDTKSAAGRFKFAIDMNAREKAWHDLEEEVIKSCVRKHGPIGVNKESENVEQAT